MRRIEVIALFSPLLAGLAVAFLVNIGLIGLYFWGQDGQTTLVELRNDGGAFRALTDGKQVVPGGNDQRSAAVLDVPERGTIILVVAPPAPALPGPSGLDSIVVTGPDGRVLFRDDFDELDPDTWEVLAGEFEVIDGVLTAKSTESDNSLLLRSEGWSEYDVVATYRNSRAGVIGVNVTGEGRLFYHTVFLRNLPDFDGEVVWALYDERLNAATIAAQPGRTVYVATWDPKARIEELEPQ